MSVAVCRVTISENPRESFSRPIRPGIASCRQGRDVYLTWARAYTVEWTERDDNSLEQKFVSVVDG